MILYKPTDERELYHTFSWNSPLLTNMFFCGRTGLVFFVLFVGLRFEQINHTKKKCFVVEIWIQVLKWYHVEMF